eukprot:1839442-Prymnesium_polylepis.1
MNAEMLDSTWIMSWFCAASTTCQKRIGPKLGSSAHKRNSDPKVPAQRAASNALRPAHALRRMRPCATFDSISDSGRELDLRSRGFDLRSREFDLRTALP